MSRRSSSIEWASRIGLFVLIVFVLSIAREVFIPFALSILFSFLLHPAVVRLQRWGFPRAPAVIVVSILAVTTAGLVFYHLGSEMASFLQQLPKYKSEFTLKVKELGVAGSNLGGFVQSFRHEMQDALASDRSKDANDNPASLRPSAEEDKVPRPESDLSSQRHEKSVDSADEVRRDSDATVAGNDAGHPLFVKAVDDTQPGELWGWLLSASSLLAPIGTGGLVLVFTLFLLVYQEDLRDRFIKVVSGGQFVTTTHALNEAGERITRYLVAQTIVNGSYGIVVSAGLWLIGATMTENGFPNILLWGACCAMLRFIPYAGPVIAGCFPIAIALAVFPGFNVFFAVLSLIILLELLSNNLLEPWLYGSSTGISAVAVIFASVFWGWLWGPVGLLLATPLTVCLVVLGKHVSPFRVFRILLGEGEPLGQAMRFYQRLLAKDRHQAMALAKEKMVQSDMSSLLDSMIVPTLRRMRKDRKEGRLRSEHELQMSDTIIEMLEELAPPPKEEHCAGHLVIAIPTRNAVEVKLLQIGLSSWVNPNLQVSVFPSTWMPTRILSNLKSRDPDIVVIGVLGPGGLTQTEFLASQIRKTLPDTKLILNYMGKPARFDALFQRMRASGISYVATSFGQTNKFVRMFLSDDETSGIDSMENQEAVPQ